MYESIKLLENECKHLKSCLDDKEWATEPNNEYHIKVRSQYIELYNDYQESLTILKYENQRKGIESSNLQKMQENN